MSEGCASAGRDGARFDSPQQAVAAMCGRVRPVGVEEVPLEAAAGRVLAAPVVADRPSPCVDVSAMDGYAVGPEDLGPGRLPIAGDIRIGREPPALARGSALRIVTGAAVPAGSAAVVKREDVQEEAGHITISAAGAAATPPGTSIRRRGENIGEGEQVVGAGVRVTPALAAALAAFGRVRVQVHRRVRVAILTTGDELVPATATPTMWQLRDSNGPAVRALVMGLGWAQMADQRRVGDEQADLARAVQELLATADALILTGGVSMGMRDFVPSVLRQVGAEVLFHKIPQRPGRPVLGSLMPDGRPILALPGNPMSVMVTARRMVVPVLARMAGVLADEEPAPAVLLDEADQKRLDLWWHRPVRLTGPGRARLVGGKGSGDLVAAARSDGFVEVPPGHVGAGPWPFFGWSA